LTLPRTKLAEFEVLSRPTESPGRFLLANSKGIEGMVFAINELFWGEARGANQRACRLSTCQIAGFAYFE